MPKPTVKHVKDSRAFRELEQLIEDFRAGKCVGFFYFALQLPEVKSDPRLVEIRGNCLSPDQTPWFRAAFKETRDTFHTQGAFGLAEAEERCVRPPVESADPDDLPPFLVTGGNA